PAHPAPPRPGACPPAPARLALPRPFAPQPPDQLHRLAVGRPPVHPGAFEDRRHLLPLLFPEERSQAGTPDLALADRGVSIPVGAARVAGVVDVEELELVEADLR